MTEKINNLLHNIASDFAALSEELDKAFGDMNSKIGRLECEVERNRSTLRKVAELITSELE